MRRRLFLLLLAIVLVPLVGLTWFGTRVAEDRQAVAAHQFRTLTHDRLRDLSRSITQSRLGLERDFERHLVVEGHEELRQVRRGEPLFSEVFLLETDGRLLFPPTEDAPRSVEEDAFLARTEAIWRGDAILYAPPEREQRAPRTRSSPPRSVKGDSLVELSTRSPRGWIAWHWKEGLHLLFWRRMQSGRIAGAEIERVVLLSRIVGALPSDDLAEGRIVLSDSRGDAIYQWGPYEPSKDQIPIAEHILDYPLDSLRFSFYASPGQRAAFLDSSGLGTYLGLAALALALFALAVFFYRELSRDLREASQRVTFVTQVSHELKTPLANIRIYAELLENELEEDDPLTERTRVIVAESERLTRLINNILTFAKQKRGQLMLEAGSVDVDPLIERVLSHFGPALDVRNIEVSFSGHAPEAVSADADAVEQILANLISNVEKYGAAGGRLDITTVQVGHQTEIVVQDAGPGVPERHRDRIFEPFHRVSDRLTDGVTGTGIGLAIARDLARRCGGDLKLADSPRGARFVLTLRTKETP